MTPLSKEIKTENKRESGGLQWTEKTVLGTFKDQMSVQYKSLHILNIERFDNKC